MTLTGKQKETKNNVHTIQRYLRIMLANSFAIIGLSWDLDQEEKCNGTFTDKSDGSWDRMTEEMMANFSGSGHPPFRASSAFEKEELRSKGGDKKSIHFNTDHEKIELLLRTVISANQLSIHGVTADLCDEVPKESRTLEKSAAPDHLEKMEIPTDLSIAEIFTNTKQRRNLVQEYERKIRTIVRGSEIIQTMFRYGFEACGRRTILLYKQKKDNGCNIYAENTRRLEMKGDSCGRMDSQG